jgi:hypothetical protein
MATAARKPGAKTRQRTFVLARRRAPGAPAVELEVLASEAGVHPDLARRFVRLGLLEPVPGSTRAAPLFPRDAAARLARATRLRRDLGLSYAGAVLACELLTRIAELEARLARYEPPNEPTR